jgi:periplasmic divalent cation tolerance protein
MDEVVICVVTVPEGDTGQNMARTLVEERLAACVNIVPKIRSIYRWEGRICDDPEALLWIKTKRSLIKEMEQRVKEVHPYEVPEIIFLSVEDGWKEYLSWVVSETKTPEVD